MAVSAFCNQLVRFFEELTQTFPDERDIKSGLEVIQGARKINPRMVLDMFYEHVAKDLTTAIMNDDVESVITFGRPLLSLINIGRHSVRQTARPSGNT